LDVAVTGGLAIGPVVATVSKVGLTLSLKPVVQGQPAGNLGMANVGFGFKPPTGISVALSAPGVAGVGFLDIDIEHNQYLGAIAISVADVDIEAVGVLTTKLPTGKGYSLVVVVSCGFPPVELGFGFSLVGIGGLVGINRTMDVPGVQALARSGGLDNLMFPADLIHKAPQVAASLAALFPPAQDHFLIGPAIRIEWGMDGILDAEIGVLIELTDSGGGIAILRVALLGWFHLTLPQAEAPVADITLDILGLVDIPAKLISIDAGMRDSRILTFTLTGQAALRASWGANAAFVLAIGGFNPHFNPPASFPTLQRIALTLGNDNPRLRFTSYLALTPNTLQFGASADLYASEGPAAVAASLTFDCLIQFKPFGLIVDLSISATVLFDGSALMVLTLDLHLTGPAPWHVAGSASFSVLFASFSVPVNITVGDPPAPQVSQRVDLDQNLLHALGESHSWQTGPPPGAGAVVVKGSDQPSHAVHPTGTLTVRQHAVPLKQRVERYGPDLLDNPCQYDVTMAQLGTRPPASYVGVTDYFAPAQFLTLSDDEKLARPSFEPMQAGVTIGSSGLVLPVTPAGQPAAAIDTPSTRLWQMLVLDSPDPTPAAATGPSPAPGPQVVPGVPPTRRTVSLPADLLKAQQPASAAAVNGVLGRGSARYAGPVKGFAVVDPTYAVLGLNLSDTTVAGKALPSDLSSHTAARSWISREVGQAAVQVVYASELPGNSQVERRG
jgi:hypothetical protein